MKRVLIISSPFFDYPQSVGRAFAQQGWEVRIETYDEPIHPFHGWLKWRHKFSRHREQLKEKSREAYATYITAVFHDFRPQLVFSYNGTILKDSTLDAFRQEGAKVIFWMYDSVLRPDRARCRAHIDHADAVFCFEKKDVDYYASQQKTAYFLPLACDTSVYHPLPGIPKDIDLLFVGTLYTSKRRKALIEDVVAHYPKARIVVYGQYKPFFKNPVTWLFHRHYNVFKNYNIAPERVNALFARTRIALNIHHEQTSYGANQRVFETCGAGAYQICDSNPFIAGLFPQGEIGLYANREQLFACIDQALAQDMSTQAAKAHDIVLSHHTFAHRVATMLNVVYGAAPYESTH